MELKCACMDRSESSLNSLQKLCSSPVISPTMRRVATLRQTGAPCVEKPFRVQQFISVVEQTMGKV